jgi:hypothetical protein
MNQRTIKYFESVIRDLAADGFIKVRDVTVLAHEIRSFITGV